MLNKQAISQFQGLIQFDCHTIQKVRVEQFTKWDKNFGQNILALRPQIIAPEHKHKYDPEAKNYNP